mmetsp:Transcript_7162/g.6254  ORF Transcript_7162/g.6254 Transcript_7162/m.6254 type:complete len:86 (+) Transcript_7162:14-271(+)
MGGLCCAPKEMPVAETAKPRKAPEQEQIAHKRPMLEYLEEHEGNAETGATQDPVPRYKAAKGDSVDEALARMINHHSFRLPVIRM